MSDTSPSPSAAAGRRQEIRCLPPPTPLFSFRPRPTMATTPVVPASTSVASASVAVDVRAHELRACATRRWLVKDELVFLLLHHKQQSAVPYLRALQARPPSGTLLFYDSTEVTDFKKDGWRWQKRKDNSGRVREDRAKLVINREVIILGTYVHSAEVPTFHRRNYYLRDSNQHVILVHYFDEVYKIDPSMGALVPPKAQPLPHTILSTQLPPKGLKRALPPWNPSIQPASQPHPSQPSSPLIKVDPNYDSSHSVDVIMKECFAMDYYDDRAAGLSRAGDLEEPQPFPHFDEDDTLLSELSSLLSPVSTSSHEDGVRASAPPAVPLVVITDFSPGWDFIQGGAKILLCLAAPLPSPEAATLGDIFVQFGAYSRSPAERISDTVLRCAAPRAMGAGHVELFVCRCSSTTSLDCTPISTRGQFEYKSVINSPVQTPTIANETMTVEVTSLSDIQNNGVISGGKRGRSPGAGSRLTHRNSAAFKPPDGRRWSNPDCSNLSAFVDTDLDERQCKIRVVERLAEFQDAIRTTSTNTTQDANCESNVPHDSNASSSVPRGQRAVAESGKGPSPDSSASASLDDGAIEALSDQDLESLSEQLIENVVRQLVTIAHTSEELLDELNSLDETGLSLLHYVSFYNYAHLIPLLLSHGAQVNQQSTQGQTPLHLAAGCGHEKVVTKLLEAGAEVFALDFDGFTPAERAEKSGHAEVAQRLRKFMGESTVIHGSFEAELANDGSWDDSMEDMEIDSDNGALSSLHSSQERLALTPEATFADSDLEGFADSSGAGLPSMSRATSYVGKNQEHNRKLLLGAFSTMSLHDKCALSLSISRDLAFLHSNPKRRGSSISDDSIAAPMTTGSSSASSPTKGTEWLSISSSNSINGGEGDSMRDTDVKSVIADDEENLNKLEAAMELMGPEEIQSLEEEARVIQHNVRAWLLRRNCRNMRETTKRLHEATKSIENQQKQQDEQHMQAVERHLMSQQEISERERAAVTVQAAARSMLARKTFLQTRNVTIKVQAATRGVLCRKNFARMKTHALASLVIQRNVREWLSKQPGGTSSERASAESLSGYTMPTKPVVPPSFKTSLEEDEDAALARELNAALESPSMVLFGAP